MERFRWGIIGLGNIARSFATGLQSVPEAQLVAVGSRSQEKADAFGEKFDAAKRYDSYEAVVSDPDVDAVYIATPHSEHHDNALLAIAAGKPVLLEKPFTINAIQAQEVITAAQSHGVFLMEAMWSRFFPILTTMRQRLAEGAIGEPRMLQSDFGFRAGVNPESRLFNPKLGGGALLDVGVYTISLASYIFGEPTRMTGLATLGETGVDEQSAFVLGYGGGELAILSTAIRTNTPHEATIIGTEGNIRIHGPWWKPTTMTISASGKEPEVITLPYEGNGYQFQAIEVAQRVRAGELESPIMPWRDTLSVMKTMDTLRADWGLKYPME